MNLKQLIFGGTVAGKGFAGHSGSAQEWLPIRDIINGVVITSDGRYVKILELLPINMDTLSPMESEAVISDYAAFLKIAPADLVTTVISQKFDLEQYVNQQKTALEHESNEMCCEMIANNISEVTRIVTNESITHRFFLSFGHEPMMKTKDNSPEAISQRLNEEANTMSRYLAQCGLEVLVPEYMDNAILELFYEVINKHTSRRIRLPSGVFDMLSTVHGVYGEEHAFLTPEDEQPKKKRWRKNDVRPLDAGRTTILDMLSPNTIDLRQAGYIEVDGIYHAYLYIAGYGYETVVGKAWLASLVNAGEGISLSFHAQRQSREKMLGNISNATMLNRSRMRDVGDTRQDYEELDDAINAGLYLKNGMNRNGEDFYYMYTLIEVVADDLATLEKRVASVETLCVARDMFPKRCDFKHGEVFQSFLPLLKLDADIERKAKRNALTSGVAAAFPYTTFEVSDRGGVFVGQNMYNSSPCFLDFFNDYRYVNGNTAVFGSTGAGKSSTLQTIGGRIRQQGKQVIFIIPKKGHEYRPLCQRIGGQYVRLSPSSKDCINIMDIRRSSLDGTAKLRNIDSREDSLLADKIAKLSIFYSLLKTNLSEEDKNYIDTSLVECYQAFGITFDNRSLFDDDGLLKTMPTIPDWYATLQGKEETRHLAVVLTRFVTGSARNMGGRTNIDATNKYIVIDTTGMPEDLKLAGLFWATEFTTDVILNSGTGERGSMRSAMIADELWDMIGANSNPMAANYIVETVKLIRSMGGIAITGTQGMADMYALEGGKYGKAIMDSCRIKFVMQMEENEARLIQATLNLSEDEVRMITRFRRGEGLLCIGHNHVPIAVYISPMEYECITTSPTDLQARFQAQGEKSDE